MSQLTAATCARCGAPLQLDPSTPKQICSFCGNEHLFTATAPPYSPPVAHPPYAPPFPPVPPPPTGTRAALTSPGPSPNAFVLLGASAFMMLLVGGIVAASLAGSGHGSAAALPGGGGIVPAGERLQWSSTGTSVVPARVDGDTIEDFVGRYVILDLSGETTQTLFVGGFSGATFQRVWKAGPYGTLSEAAGSTHFTVVGDRVAVADFRSTLHVLDVTTGKELRRVRLSDRARNICSPLDTRKQVWIELADRNNQIVDLESGKSEAAATRPAWCRGGGDAFRSCAGTRAACDDEDRSAPKRGGLRVDLIFTDGNTTVATAHKEPGTAIPMALGLDAKKNVTWTAAIPADPATTTGGMHDGAGDLAAGRFFTSYELAGAQGSRLVSLDAKSGARVWDVQVTRSESGSGVEGLAATATRVYVPHWTWLDVHDAASGKLLGTVGVW